MKDAGCAITTPQLDVSFHRHPTRGTYLDRRLFRWPYTLSRGFRLDTAPAHMLTLILQTVSGAIQADDRLVQRIHVGADAAAHVTTQGATAVYRAPSALGAEDDVELSVEHGGFLQYLPEPRILFPDSRLSQRTTLALPDSATAMLCDGFVLHDPQAAARGFRHYSAELQLLRPDGQVLALDRLDLGALPQAAGARARYRAFGTLMVATTRSAAWLDALCATIDAAMPSREVYAAASPLPNDAGLSLRVAATDGRHLRLALHAGWSAVRTAMFGVAPPPRRG